MSTPEAPSWQAKDVAEMTQTERFYKFYLMFNECRELPDDNPRRQAITEEFNDLRIYAHDYVHGYAPEMDSWLGQLWGLTLE